MGSHGRWLLAATAVTVITSGCGNAGSETTVSPKLPRAVAQPRPPAHDTSGESDRPPPTQARLIDSFDAKLLNYHVVRVRWKLAKASSLELDIAGVRHGSTRNQTAGGLPIRPGDADTRRAASKSGTDRLDFEFGEYNFHGYRDVQFRLRARGPHHTVDASQPIVLHRRARP